jgi:hypothetical protein
MKMYGRTAPRIINLGARRKWVASFTNTTLYPWRNKVLLPIGFEVRWALEQGWRKETSIAPAGNRTALVHGRPARSLFAIPTELVVWAHVITPDKQLLFSRSTCRPALLMTPCGPLGVNKRLEETCYLNSRYKCHEDEGSRCLHLSDYTTSKPKWREYKSKLLSPIKHFTLACTVLRLLYYMHFQMATVQ